MSNGIGVFCLAALVFCAGTKAGWAADQADEPAPLMRLINQTGLGDVLDPLHLKVTGHVEGSLTYDVSSSQGGVIAGRVFDFESEDPTFNQFSLAIERVVTANSESFDLGGRVEWMYGADARKVHSTGLFDYYGADPENQFDLTQAYVDVAIPIGKGVRLRLGKFVTTLGFETIDPAGNWLYSHSFMFGAIPFTHTGVLATYQLNDRWMLESGVTRGWDDALEDKNAALDFLGRVVFQATASTSVQMAICSGPERAGDNGSWRNTFDGIINHQISDEWKLGGEGLWVMDGGMEESWYGIAGYVQYRPCGNRFIAVNTRLEWFVDESGNLYGTSADLYELTVGMGITPFAGDRYGQYLTIRPEIRCDYAGEDFFNGGADHFQFTAAIDAVYTF